MKKVLPNRMLLLLATSFASWLCLSQAYAQNEGIGTFSDLVTKAIENAPTPTPTPTPVEERVFVAGVTEKEVAPIPCTLPFFSAPTAGLEYDYRLIQQKGINGLRFDVNEAHGSFAFTLASATTITLDYFHVWLDGSNDLGVKQTSDANGIRAIFQQTISNNLIFVLPFVFKEDDAETISPIGRRTSTTDVYVLNPLVVFRAQPIKTQPLTVSLSPGYRLILSHTTDIQPLAPEVDGWNGTFTLLAGANYALKKSVIISGSATWNHLTNFYLSNPAPRPDDNSFALGGSITFFNLDWVLPRPCSEEKDPRISFRIAYQYDGFNRDSYSHSITVAGTYRF
jgi:hypothetical protein